MYLNALNEFKSEVMFMLIKPVIVGEIFTNCYVVFDKDTHEGIVIDPGAEVDKINALLKKYSVKVKSIVLTHGHFDHIEAAEELKKATGAPILVHAEDASMLQAPDKNWSDYFAGREVKIKNDRTLQDGEVVEFGGCKLKVLHTPGHSKGGICLAGDADRIIFTGDTLFCNGIGRTDLPNMSFDEIIGSINNKLMTYPDETEIYPGHGYMSTIGKERRNLDKYE